MQQRADTASPMHPHPYRVAEVHEEIAGCVTLHVQPTCEDDDCRSAPGQFYMVYVFGHGEVPISVSGTVQRTGELIFTVMAVGSVTRALCAVKAGDTIGLRGPFGSAWPVEQAKGRDLIVIAGGLGLAPLRPALYHLLQHRDDYGELALLYGAREPKSILFAEELAGWRTGVDIDVEVTVDRAGREWPGRVGVVTELLQGRRLNAGTTSALICGPEIMMRFSAYALRDLGVPSENIHVSMERNMQCAVRMCGRCQYGPFFVCHDGPVFSFDRVERLFKIREV